MNCTSNRISLRDPELAKGIVHRHKSEPVDNSLRYLAIDEYPLWDSLVEASPQGSVFCRSWWLTALRDQVRVLALFRNRYLAAGIPLYREKRFGITMCGMPKLTQTWGLVMEPFSGKPSTIASQEMRLMELFAEQLAKERIFYQVFHPSLQNWLPFYWHGFKQTSRVTYVIEDLSRIDRLWEQIDSNRRHQIRKAERCGLTVKPCAASVVFDIAVKTFRRQGRGVPFDREYFERLYCAAKTNSTGECFAASDGSGGVHAASWFVWDGKRLYDLISGADPELRASGAQSLLLWYAMQFAAQRSAIFDLAGSALPGVEKMYREFGAKQIPVNWITKFPLWLQTYLSFRRKL